MKIGCAMLALSLAVALMVGCGGGNGNQESTGKTDQRPQKLKSLRLTLEGYPDAENVGVLMADEKGYFAAAGLNVEVLHPVDSDNVPEYLAAGADDFGLLPQPQVVMAQEEGLPLVAVGALVAKPALAVIWPKNSDLHDLADLKGKTIAINGFSFEEAFLEALLAQAGLMPEDIEIKSVSYGLVPALVKGRADAILGSENIEGLELEAQGLEPTVTPLRELGVPPYEELVMVTRRDRLSGDPRWIRRFASAVSQGTAAAAEDPEAAAAAILAARKRLELPAAESELVEAKVEATLPLLSENGRMNAGRAQGLVAWMHDQGLIKRQLPVSGLLTDRFVQSGS